MANVYIYKAQVKRPNSRRGSGGGAGGAGVEEGLETHCILGTADERRSPSLSFRCLILP